MPHAHVYALDRAALGELCEARELARPLEALPPRVTLLAPPDAEGPEALRALWRALYHARLHDALEAALAPLGDGEVRALAHELGQAAFDEARMVLRQDDRLLPGGDRATLVELGATVLELARFDPDELAHTFPGLDEPARLGARLLGELDLDALAAACRPPGAPGAAPAAVAAPPPDAPPGAPDPRADRLLARLEAHLGPQPGALAALRAAVRSPRLSRPHRLLHDLDRACQAHERDAFRLDVLAPLSGQPLRRALPLQGHVRRLRALRAARARLPLGGLPPGLDGAVAAWLDRAERLLCDAVRPPIEAALGEVALRPASVPERVAAQKLVAELVDRVVARGFLSIGELRDALARNQLKLDDLEARDLWRGDALLRLDRTLARSLEGIHRRGEIYLRVLARVGAVAGGTRAGRLLARHVALPAGGAFVGLEGLQHVVGPLAARLGAHPPHLVHPAALGAVAALLWLLLHVPRARAAAAAGAADARAALGWLVLGVPRWILARPAVRRVLGSAPVCWAGRYVVKPLAVALPVWALVPGLGPLPAALAAAAVFAGGNVLLNSQPGRLAQEAAIDWAGQRWRELRRRVLPGLIALVLDTFRRLADAFERALYAGDEWLRLRSGEGRGTLVAKAVLSLGWRALTYLARIYMNLLVEPQVNPVKHFPVVTVASKIMLPMAPATNAAITGALAPLVGHALAQTVAAPTVVLLPGFFGFLVWELKEAWKLYRANRPVALGPVLVGHHGETLPALLRPGFHSGTVPKLFRKLRRAARGHGPAARHRAALHEVEHALRTFAERELCALLAASPRWSGPPLRAGAVRLSSNRVRLALEGPGPDAALRFEEQSGWLIAGVGCPGWMAALDPAARACLDEALAGFYKLAGVTLLAAQVSALVGPRWDVADEGLVTWPGEDHAVEVVYPLAGGPTLAGRVRAGAAAPPPLPAARLRFADQPIRWDAWVRAWSPAPAGLTGRTGSS